VRDLFILVADSGIKITVETLLSRRQKSFKIRSLDFKTDVHPKWDPGGLGQGVEFIRALIDRNEYRKYIMIFDYHGCGSDKPAAEIQDQLAKKAQSYGFTQINFRTIIIEPELEIWAWKDAFHLEKLIGWREGKVAAWIRKNKIALDQNQKPRQPKEIYQKLLDSADYPKSNDNFRVLGKKIGLKNCRNDAFNQLVQTLQEWFPE